MSLHIQNLTFAYCTRGVLNDVSFSANDGEALFVLGANGVGKTTLFRCILGLQRRYGGQIQIDGEDARSISPRALAKRVAYIPQNHGAAFAYSVLDMVLMGTSHAVSAFSVPREKELAAAQEALALLGIEGLADKMFSHLSGGEQQLVLIARALAQKADTLLFDEPTANLDYGNQARVLLTIRQLTDSGRAVVLSTHNPQQALTYGDRVLALSNGCVAAFGRPCEVLTEKLLFDLYGVHTKVFETENGPVLAPVIEGRRA